MKEILFPVGRLVGGSLYRSQAKTNRDGTAKLDKQGQPSHSFSFGVAFAKGASQHWAQTEWGAVVWAEGHAGFPNGEANAPSFAWKIIDGDSQVPNKKGNKPASNEGWPGHWVVWFSGTYAPKTCNANGSKEYGVADGEIIKPGHFVQVFGSVKDNKPSESPGVYMNFAMVAHAGFGPEIAIGTSVDAKAVGFGAAPLPPGASAAPLAQMQAPASTGAPAIPPGAPPAPVAPPAVPAASTVAAPPIVPNPAFLNAPVPAVPAAPAARTMTGKAPGVTYQQMRDAGWTDEALVAQGYMTA